MKSQNYFPQCHKYKKYLSNFKQIWKNFKAIFGKTSIAEIATLPFHYFWEREVVDCLFIIFHNFLKIINRLVIMKKIKIRL